MRPHRLGYREALAHLERLPSRLVKPGLERIEYLLARLGEPHLYLEGRAIHIGGTNGKGSLVAMLSQILKEAGYRVGSYTSPHLVDWCERIRIDGQPIPEEELARLILRLRPIWEEMEGDLPTVFEALTAAAFQYFCERAVDLAVVEVGLGGRFDATNVLQRPLVAIITHVEADHLDLLGPTLERVAWEKAGIAKPGAPLLTGERCPHLLKVIAEECRRQGAELRHVDSEPELLEFDWERQLFRVGDSVYELGLLGLYQRENLAVALQAVELLRAQGLAIPDEAVRRGLARARWPGRFEVVRQRPWVVLDGAHNPSGTRALLATLELYWERYLAGSGGRRWLLFGALGDKNLEEMARTLFPWFDRLILTKPDYYRAAEPEELEALAERLGLDQPMPPAEAIEVVAPAGEALRWALERLDPRDLLVVAGSLYLIGELEREAAVPGLPGNR